MKGSPSPRLSVDISRENLQARGMWDDVYKVLKWKNRQEYYTQHFCPFDWGRDKGQTDKCRGSLLPPDLPYKKMWKGILQAEVSEY